MLVYVHVQVKEHTSHLEAELEKHMAAASAECQSYAKEVAGVSLPVGSHPAQNCSSAALVNLSSKFQFSGFTLGLRPAILRRCHRQISKRQHG